MRSSVTLSLDKALWLRFRGECIARGVLASDLVMDFMRQRLEKWGEGSTIRPENSHPSKAHHNAP